MGNTISPLSHTSRTTTTYLEPSTTFINNNPLHTIMQAYHEFLSEFTQETVPYQRLGQELFMPGELPATEQKPIYTTQRLGRIDRKGFHPSIVLLDILAEHTDKKIVVDDKAAWLFLCGRNILKEAIVEQHAQEGHTLILNQKHEVLGYGKITGAGVTNKLDRGDFLRRER